MLFTVLNKMYAAVKNAVGGGSTGGGDPSGDPYFEDVVLLLPFDGANGDTTTSDLSPLGHTVTLYDNASISTASSVFGGSSVFFDTSGDYVEIPYSTELDLSLTDFTIEFWLNTQEDPAPADFCFFTQEYTTQKPKIGLALTMYSGELIFGAFNGSWTRFQGSGWAPTLNTWHHVALTRQGNYARLWIDGVQKGPTHNLTGYSFPFDDSPFFIGKRWDLNADPFMSHYQDDFRITKGVARYTQTFTPPTQAHYTVASTATDNFFNDVTLLLPFEGTNGDTFTTDLSDNATPITFYGGAQISNTQAKWGSTSLYLDGVDSYLRADDALSQHTDVLTPMTIECWVYPTATTGYVFGINDTADAYNRLLIGLDSIYIDNVSRNYTTGMSTGAWHHLAYAYDGVNHYVYIDGQRVFTREVDALGTPLSNCVLGIGAEFDAANGGLEGNFITGYLDDIRITSGVFRYDTNFDVPTSAYTLTGDASAASVVLLSNFDGAYDDESSYNHTSFTLSGTTGIDTTTFKFGSGSADINGDGMAVVAQQSDEFTFGTGDFTIEFWMYKNTLTSNQNIVGFGGGACAIYHNNGSQVMYVNINGTNAINCGLVPQLQWHHIVLQRQAGVFYAYVNGEFRGNSSSTYDSESLASGDFSIGGRIGSTAYFKGTIDSIRVYKGLAKYPDAVSFDVPTETFPTSYVSSGGTTEPPLVVPPTALFSDVSLLLPFDGTDGDTTTSDLSNDGCSITLQNTTEIKSAQSKFGGTSLGCTSGNLFFSRADVVLADSAISALWGTFTFETWVYINKLSGSTGTATTAYGFPIYKTGGTTTANGGTQLYVDTSGVLTLERYDSSGVKETVDSGATTLSEGQWYHIAVTQSGGASSATVQLFVNGVRVNNTTVSKQTSNTSSLHLMFSYLPSPVGGVGANGYIDDTRLVTGFVLYDGDFTPPTAAHPTDSI